MTKETKNESVATPEVATTSNPSLKAMNLEEKGSQIVKHVETAPERRSFALTATEITTLTQSGMIPFGTPLAQIQVFSQVCKQVGLSPFRRQIYLIKRSTKNGDRYTVQTGIDGYRSIAVRTGEYAGNDDYEFDNEDAQHPKWAKSTVYRNIAGKRTAFTAKARWSEYAVETNPIWQKMPFHMLGKVAECLSLRKGFPELSGVYTDEEMEQGSDVGEEPIIEAEVVQQAPKTIEVKEELDVPLETPKKEEIPAKAKKDEQHLAEIKRVRTKLGISSEQIINMMKALGIDPNNVTKDEAKDIIGAMESSVIEQVKGAR